MIVALTLTLYLGLIVTRAILSARFIGPWSAPKSGPEPNVTVLQPILGGDEALEACLTANLTAHPHATFYWLVDEDDPLGRSAAARAMEKSGHLHVSIVVGPPPLDGENPKVAKLARALPLVRTQFVAVLDDDTMLPAGGLRAATAVLKEGGVAFGLPLYVARANVWSRLVTGFVNGASLLTYPAAAELAASRTLNGMFYVVRTEELRALGSFEAILGQLTDDVALARLYLDAGRPVVQTAVVHPIETTVRNGHHYLALMRRWMIFANRYVAENPSGFTVLLIGGSTLAPALLLFLALATNEPALLFGVFATLAVKTGLNAALRWRYARARTTLVDAVFEVLADLLTPLHLLSALIKPRRLAWRGRELRLERGRIEYG